MKNRFDYETVGNCGGIESAWPAIETALQEEFKDVDAAACYAASQNETEGDAANSLLAEQWRSRAQAALSKALHDWAEMPEGLIIKALMSNALNLQWPTVSVFGERSPIKTHGIK